MLKLPRGASQKGHGSLTDLCARCGLPSLYPLIDIFYGEWAWHKLCIKCWARKMRFVLTTGRRGGNVVKLL